MDVNSSGAGSANSSQGAPSGEQNDNTPKFSEADYHRLSSENQRLQQEFSDFRQRATADSEVLGRMRDVFTGGDQEEVDPIDSQIADLKQKLDWALSFSLTEKGRAIPMTVANQIQTFQDAIDRLEHEKRTSRELAALKAQLARSQDPEYITNQNAYAQIDSMCVSAVTNLYGAGPETADARRAQYNALVEQVAETLKDLQKNNPQKWAEVKRTPPLMKYIVEQHQKHMLPPAVLRSYQEQELQNWQPDQDEIFGMIREAKLKIQDPVVRQRTIAALRRDYWNAEPGGRKAKRRLA